MSLWHSSRVEDLRSRGPQFRHSAEFSQVQSEQYHHQSLCTRVKYLKLSDVKNQRSLWHNGRVQD